MWTIHLINKNLNNPIKLAKYIKKCRKLMKELYDLILKKDQYFHFLFEPEMIIRLQHEFMDKVIEILRSKKIDFITYEYPFPKEKGQFGEDKKSFGGRNLEMITKIHHLNTIATLTLKKSDIRKYADRIIHTFLNMNGFEYYDEAKLLGEMALRRAFLEGYYHDDHKK